MRTFFWAVAVAPAVLGFSSQATAQIKVVGANFFPSCSMKGNALTTHSMKARANLAMQCDGKPSCEVVVDETALQVPQPTCGKRLSVEYRCTNLEDPDTGMAPLTKSFDADDRSGLKKKVTLDCAAPKRAETKPTAPPPPPPDETGLIEAPRLTRRGWCVPTERSLQNIHSYQTNLCRRKKTCVYELNEPAGKFAPAGCQKDFVAEWQCINKEARRAHVSGNATTFTFSCEGSYSEPTIPDAPQAAVPPPPPPVIEVLHAGYGYNCTTSTFRAGFKEADRNKTKNVATVCDGKETCDFPVNAQALGDPAPSCGKWFNVQWTCVDKRGRNIDGAANRIVFDQPAQGSATRVQLTCAANYQRPKEPVRERETARQKEEAAMLRRETKFFSLADLGIPAKALDEMRRAMPGFGVFVSIPEIKRLYDAKVKKGELPVGGKSPDDLMQTKCPTDGISGAGCSPPIERYEAMLPEVEAFISSVWGNVVAQGGGWRRKASDPRITSKDEGVEIFYNFGCRLVSHYLPGFARIAEVRIPPARPDTAEDWDKKITDQAVLNDALGKGKGGGEKPDPHEYKGPPPKEEVIEVCSVTHLQIEETLKRDIGLIVASKLAAKERPREQAPPAQVAEDRTIYPQLDGSSFKLADGKPFNHARPLDRAKICTGLGVTGTATGGFGGIVCGGKNFRISFHEECRVQWGEKLGVRMIPFIGAWSCYPSPDQLRFKIAETLVGRDLTELAPNQPHLRGETIRSIVNRLLGFYRKGGSARVYRQGMSGVLSDAKVTRLRLPDAPAEAKDDADNQNKSAPRTAEREGLRREVDQWTSAWEYTLVAKYIEKSPSMQRRGALGEYRRAERAEVERFWDDCSELWEICKNPQFAAEREACVRCAYRGVLDHCLDGQRRGGTCTEDVSIAYQSLASAQGPLYGAGDYARMQKMSDDLWAKSNANKGRLEAADAALYKALGAMLGTRQTKLVPRSDFTHVKTNVGGAPAEFDFNHATGQTFFAWLVGQTLQAIYRVAPIMAKTGIDVEKVWQASVKSVAAQVFAPFGKADPHYVPSKAGKRYFDQTPLTPAQKCFLWTGDFKANGDCDLYIYERLLKAVGTSVTPLNEHLKDWWQISRHDAPLFKLVRENDDVKKALAEVKSFYDGACAKAKCRGAGLGDAVVDLEIWKNIFDVDALKFAGLYKEPSAATETPAELGDIGGTVADVAMPIIGKVLGLLMKAAGIEDTMKQLAKAAGLTPEQSLDCEDVEYRRSIMKIAEKSPTDNKRGCLTKAFARNFVDVLEGIIIMLGSKLVDWAIDILQMALKAVKLALITAAGSVPFAGGVLAALVDVAWDVLINFGMKALLKGLVVSQLPKWLKIRELAGEKLEELIEKHPIVSVVAGIILQLIESAVTYGDKGALDIGFASVLATVQKALESSGQHFWVRAFIHARKELIQKSAEKKDLPETEQIKHLLIGLARGFAESVRARLDDDSRVEFDDAIKAVTDLFEKGSLSDLGKTFIKNPTGFLGELFGQKLFPAVIPVITAFVKMPESTRDLLRAASKLVSDAVRAVRAGKVDGQKILVGLEGIINVVRNQVVAKLPIGDAGLLDLVLSVYDSLVGVIKGGAAGLASLNPVEFLQKVKGVARGAIDRVLAASSLGPEKALIGAGVDKLFEYTTTPAQIPADARAALTALVGATKTYAQDRLQALAAGTGVEAFVKPAVDALFNPEGLILKGEEFARNIATNLPAVGQRALGQVATAAATMLGAKAREAVQFLSGALAKGILETGGKLLSGDFRFAGRASEPIAALGPSIPIAAMEGGLGQAGGFGLAALAAQGARGLIAAAKAAVVPAIAALKDQAVAALQAQLGGAAAAVGPHIDAIFSGLAGLFDNPSGLVAQGQAAWKAFTTRVAANLKEVARVVVGTMAATAQEAQAFIDKLALDRPAVVTSIVHQVIDRVAGGTPSAALLKEAVAVAIDFAANPAKLDAFLKLAPAVAAEKLIAVARAFVQPLIDSVLRDPLVRQLVTTGLTKLLDFYKDGLAVASQGPALAAKIKAVLSDLVGAFKVWAKARFSEVASGIPGGIKAFVDGRIDAVAKLVTDLLNGNAAALTALSAGGFGAVVDDVLSAVGPVVREAIVGAGAAAGPIVMLVDGLWNVLRSLLKNPAGLREMATNKIEAVKKMLPSIITELEKFFVEAIVTPLGKAGVANPVVEFAVKEAFGMLKDRQKIEKFLDATKSMSVDHLKAMLKDVVGGFLIKIIDGMKGTVGTILKQALDFANKGSF